MFSNSFRTLLQQKYKQVVIRTMSTSTGLGESKWITLPQGRIHYRETGKGKPIIFVHGALMNGDIWRNVVPSLATKYHCICPDFPLGGHPEVMKKDADLSIYGLADLFNSFTEALKLSEKPTFVGNDSGGALTQVMLTRHPDVASRAIFLNCDCFENFPPSFFRHLAYPAKFSITIWSLKKILDSERLRYSRFGFGWLTKKPLPKEIEQSFWSRLQYPEQREDIRKFFGDAFNTYTIEAAKKLPNFKKPVLVVWGKDDKLFPIESGKRLAALFPNSKFAEIEDSYCLIQEDNPKALCEAMHKFLASS